MIFGSISEYYFSYYKQSSNGVLFYNFESPGTYALSLRNNGTSGSVSFTVHEMTTPPPVTVEGSITPSTTAGTTGGTTLALADGDDDVKIYSFTAEAGKRYSAVAYQQSGEENAQLDGSFSDAYGAGKLPGEAAFLGLRWKDCPLLSSKQPAVGRII